MLVPPVNTEQELETQYLMEIVLQVTTVWLALIVLRKQLQIPVTILLLELQFKVNVAQEHIRTHLVRVAASHVKLETIDLGSEIMQTLLVPKDPTVHQAQTMPHLVQQEPMELQTDCKQKMIELLVMLESTVNRLACLQLQDHAMQATFVIQILFLNNHQKIHLLLLKQTKSLDHVGQVIFARQEQQHQKSVQKVHITML